MKERRRFLRQLGTLSNWLLAAVTILVSTVDATAAPGSLSPKGSGAAGNGQGSSVSPKNEPTAFARVHIKKGAYYYSTFELNKALSEFNEAIRLDPDWGQGYFGRALTFSQLNNMDAAIRDLEKAISLHQGTVATDAMSELASLYHHQKKFALAKQYYDELINTALFREGKVDCEDALCCRADCELNLNQPKAAIADVTQALVYKPMKVRKVMVQRTRARAYMQIQEYKKAIDDFDAVIKYAEHESFNAMSTSFGGPLTLSGLLNERAEAYDRTGRHDLAKRDREEARLASKDDFEIAPFSPRN